MDRKMTGSKLGPCVYQNRFYTTPKKKQSQIKKGMIFEMNKTHYVPQEFLPSGVLAIISGRRIVQKIIYYRFFYLQ